MQPINNPQNMGDIASDIENLPWYQSTAGPQIAATLKAVAALILPTIQTIFHISTGIETVDRWITAVLILGFGLYALYGYVRAKKVLMGRIKQLGALNKHLNVQLYGVHTGQKQ